MAWFLLPLSQLPLAPLAVPLLLPFVPLSTYLAPSSCDRNRPPPSQVACKLTLFAPPFTQLSHPFQLPRSPTTQRLTTTTLGLLHSCYAEHVGYADVGLINVMPLLIPWPWYSWWLWGAWWLYWLYMAQVIMMIWSQLYPQMLCFRVVCMGICLLRYTVVHTVCHRANLALYFFHSFIHKYVYQHLYFHTCILGILMFSYYDIVTLELPIFISWAK